MPGQANQDAGALSRQGSEPATVSKTQSELRLTVSTGVWQMACPTYNARSVSTPWVS